MSRLHKFLHHPIFARLLVTLLTAFGLANACCVVFFPAPVAGQVFLWCAVFAGLFAIHSAIRIRFKGLMALAIAGGLTALGILGHTGPVHSLIEGAKAFIFLGMGWPEILALYADTLLPLLCLIITLAAQGAAGDESGMTLTMYVLAACVVLFFLFGQASLLLIVLPAFIGLALQWTRKYHFHILSLIIAALLVGLAYLLTPSSPATEPTLEKLAQDIRQTIEDHLLFTSQRDSFSLATEGYLPLEDRLGGKPTLSEQPVMDVTTHQTVLLRGKTYDLYTGLSWVDSLSAKRYLYHSLYNQDLRTELFLQDKPLAGADALQTEEVQVQLLKGGTTTLFAPGYTREIELQNQRMVLYFNTAAELFITRNTTSLDSYALSYLPLQAGNETIARLVEDGAAQPDPYYQTAASQYLALPEHIHNTAELKELALEAADANASPYEKALQLQAYLQANYPYSLDVETPPDRVDFVSWFLLREQKGYCTYFASAMTVLCRMHGIPARYVTGYLAKPGEDGIAHVQGKHAHAWTEIYLHGVGWLPIDATGQANQPPAGNQPPTGQRPPAATPTPSPTPTPQPTQEPAATPVPTPSSAPSSAPTQQPEDSPGTTLPPSPRPTALPTPQPQTDETPDEQEKAGNLWWMIVLVLLAALALWYYLSLPQTRAKRKKAHPSAIYFGAMESALALLKQRRAPSQTLSSFAQQLANAGLTDAAAGVDAYAARLYGKNGPADDYFAAQYRALYRRLSLPRKVIFRLQGMLGKQ